MKKSALLAIFVALFCFGCQIPIPMQYHTESPEIDVVKTTLNAYLSADWETQRAQYSDTAKIWHNVSWVDDEGMSPDEFTQMLSEEVAQLSEYDFTDQIWEMITTDEGVKWVHFWGIWRGKMKGSDEQLNVPVQVSFNVLDGKIVMEVAVYDNLPAYLLGQSIQEAEEDEDETDDSDDD